MAEFYIPIAIQRAVIVLSKGYCEYCFVPEDFSNDFFQFDHIIPFSKGGSSELKNIARTCGKCNGYKHHKTHHIDPLTQQPCRLYHPRQDDWSEHFRWHNDKLTLIGKTPIGRTTIDLLQINRYSSVNLRSLLKIVGLHPPIL